MPAKRSTMRKIKEVLRLKFEGKRVPVAPCGGLEVTAGV